MRPILGMIATVALLSLAPVIAAAEDVAGTVTYADDRPIPKGDLFVRVEDPAAAAVGSWSPITRRSSADAPAFAVDGPPRCAARPAPRVVVHLERSDGRLIARGSTPLHEGHDTRVRIILYPVAY